MKALVVICLLAFLTVFAGNRALAQNYGNGAPQYNSAPSGSYGGSGSGSGYILPQQSFSGASPVGTGYGGYAAPAGNVGGYSAGAYPSVGSNGSYPATGNQGGGYQGGSYQGGGYQGGNFQGANQVGGSPATSYNPTAAAPNYSGGSNFGYGPRPSFAPVGGGPAPGAFPSVSLGNILNQVDSNWSHTPVSRPPISSSGSPAGMSSPMAQAAPTNGFAPFGGMRQPMQSGQSPFSPASLMRAFMGGGTGSGGGFGAPGAGSGGGANAAQKQADNADITGQVEALYERASNQAAQAENDAERASSGGDRQSAASSAQYHADDARNAADTAAGITYSANQYAQDYAAQARDQANRAQAAAERARYNAAQ